MSESEYRTTCGEHIGHFTNCTHKVEPLFTIDTEGHYPTGVGRVHLST